MSAADDAIAEDTDVDPENPDADADADTTFADAVEAAAKGAEMMSYAPLWAVACTTMTEVSAKIAEAREIKSLCAIAKKADMADGFIKASKSLKEVRAALVDAMAKDDAETHTDTSVKNTLATGETAQSKVSPASLWAVHQGQASRKGTKK